MTATSLNRPSTEPRSHERWITATTDVVRITAWHDPTVEQMPGAIPTASDEMLVWLAPSLGAHQLPRRASLGGLLGSRAVDVAGGRHRPHVRARRVRHPSA